MIFVPMFLFCLLHTLLRNKIIAPQFASSPVFVLVSIIEFCAPTAINTCVMCALTGYKPREFTQMLFVEYLCAIPLSTLWLYVALWYTQQVMAAPAF